LRDRARRAGADAALAGADVALADRGDDRTMTRLDQIADVLAETPDAGVANLVRVRGNELHCSVEARTVPILAGMLRVEFGAELTFMAAVDRRADRGMFDVHYLFAPEREHWYLHATAAVPADTAAIRSLA